MSGLLTSDIDTIINSEIILCIYYLDFVILIKFWNWQCQEKTWFNNVWNV